MSVGRLRLVGWLTVCVLMLAGGACAKPVSAPGANARQCVYRENAFRSGVEPPRNVHRVEPDLTGLPPPATEQFAIVEIRIDATGRVTENCLLRGVRADVDQRVLEAVRAWRFDPPRLLTDTNIRGGDRLAAGTAVPIFMTVSIRLGPKLQPPGRP